jgi:hypothetical protein
MTSCNDAISILKTATDLPCLMAAFSAMIKVSCIHPGFIRSEINEKVKKVPFIVDTPTGCRALVKAIEAEYANSYVPAWPWAWLHWLMRIAPAGMIGKMS